MARQACEVMIGNVVTFDEFMHRITPESFFTKLQDSVGDIASTVLERIMLKRFPTIWGALPTSVKAELKEQILEETKKDRRAGAGRPQSKYKFSCGSQRNVH